MMDIVAAENVLQWGDGNGQQTYLFEYPIRRYLELSDSTGIVVVLESPQKWEKNHAVIIDTDGKIRKEIIIPSEIGTYNFSYEYISYMMSTMKTVILRLFLLLVEGLTTLPVCLMKRVNLSEVILQNDSHWSKEL